MLKQILEEIKLVDVFSINTDKIDNIYIKEIENTFCIVIKTDNDEFVYKCKENLEDAKRVLEELTKTLQN